ncbi:YesL family protein [Antribacter gilvus]|uniref:YesL family protein n=1 Tax=Antribacter gilvus TaxID=2304675 RepID=UPI000F787ECC|nr:DUF624 domain-containing protein [Antribacter gilvus]
MSRLLGWHTRAGEVGLRLALLQGLWIVHTLLGGVVLGAFPATAAVVSVLRRDAMVASGWADDAGREPLWREFHAVWRRELGPANVVGAVLAAAWLVVVVDHRLLRSVEIAAAPVLEVLLWAVTLGLVAVTATVLVLHAHFDDGPLAVLRRSLVLTVARPGISAMCAALLVAAVCLYYVLPGLAVVFGVAVPAAALVGYVWRTGLLPGPPVAPAQGQARPAAQPAS